MHTVGQGTAGIFNVNDPTMRRRLSRRRSVQNQRPHRENISGSSATCHFSGLLAKCFYLFAVENASVVAFWNDSQRSIILTAVIQMESQRNHFVQDTGRWMHMRHSLLLRPATEAGNFCAFTHRDGGVLMPRNLPIRCCHFVKKQSAHGKRFSPQCLIGDLLKSVLMSEGIDHRRLREQVSHSTAKRGGQSGNLRSQSVYFINGKNSRDQTESML
ncbi:MAG: hypothetical protein K0Q55_50 [Verrucomicrobia bacterium]|nr:hypothetical protein [Verrucomicrobiota bacterium]